MPAVRNGSRLFAEWHIVILIAADLTRFLALAFGTTESGLAHITPSMDEAQPHPWQKHLANPVLRACSKFQVHSPVWA